MSRAFRLFFFAIIFAVIPGCMTANFLKKDCTRQSATITDIQFKQVLDNVASFAKNPGTLPHFSTLGEGTTQISDTGSMTPTLMWNVKGFSGANLAMNGNRVLLENWKLEPVTIPGRVLRLRCGFQFLFSRPEIALIPLDNTKTGVGDIWCVGTSEGCIKCVNEMINLRLFPFPTDAVLPPSSAPPPSTTSPPKPPANPDVNGWWHFPNRDAAAAYQRQLIEAIDCKFPVGWFGTGCHHDVPKDACFVGSDCDSYVWVQPGGIEPLARFTLSALALASLDPPSETVTTKTEKKSDAKVRSSASALSTLLRSTNLPVQSHLQMLDSLSLTAEASPAQLSAMRPQIDDLRLQVLRQVQNKQLSPELGFAIDQLADQLNRQIEDQSEQPQSTISVQPNVDPFSRPAFIPFWGTGGPQFYPVNPTQ